MASPTTLPPQPEPTLVIQPRQGWAALDLREVWRFRDLLRTLAVRDVKLRYRQTALGFLWVILQPLIAAGIFSFVFGRLAGMPSQGLPYEVFAYGSLLGWNAFSNTLGRTSTTLVGNSALVSKVYFPRLVLPLSTIFSALVDFLVAAMLVVVLMVIYRVTPHAGILLLPVWLLGLITLALGLGLVFSGLMVSYRDVAYAVPVMTNMLLYLSPVVYSASERGVSDFYYLNPIAGLMEAFRWSLFGRGEPRWWAVAYAFAFAAVILVIGVMSFKRLERRFADVI